MRTLKPFLFLFGLLGSAYAQTATCGGDGVTAIQKQNVKNYDALQKRNNLNIKKYIEEHLAPNLQSRATSTPAAYTIPVVFHVVYPAGQAYGTGANISYLQIQSQIDALNAAYGKDYPNYNGQTHSAWAQNTSIRFCLARTTMPANISFYNGPTGTEYGVMRYANTTLSSHNETNAGATALVGLTHPSPSYFPFTSYLNIWVVANINSNAAGTVMGYAPLPLMGSYPLDGVVMRADVIGDNSPGNNFTLGFNLQQGKVLSHEVGHYLNLCHIFEGGCAGANAAGSAMDACDLNGDFICDIEPCTTQNILCNQPVPNTCSANYNTGTTTLDMIESYMSYADDDCMNTFTNDQTLRMQATLNVLRSSLWQTGNLGLTGVTGPNGCNPATLFTNITVSGACVNSPINIVNPTAGNTASSWTWTAPGSSQPSANTSSISITYTAPGLHQVILAISDGTNTIRDTIDVSITSCSLDPNRLYKSNWMIGDYSAVSFATGQPVANNVALVNNTIKCIENAVSMSDSLGNLLFYSNGRDLWTGSHTLVNPGAPLFGWDLIIPSPNGYHGTSVQGFMSFPAPKKPGKYYLVCVPPTETKGQQSVGMYARLNFVVYDAVSQTVTPSQSLSNAAVEYSANAVGGGGYMGMSENLSVIPHCNGVDYWIIARGVSSSSTTFNFYSFLVNANGLTANAAPVLSGPFPLSLFTMACDLKSNNAGNKLVCKNKNKNQASIYDFDQSTGLITNPVTLASSNQSTLNAWYSGCIFSPNDQYVYTAVNGGIDMVDVTNNTLVKTIVPSNGYNALSAYFEVGPDGIIYTNASSSGTYALGQITNPNSAANSAMSTYVPFVPGTSDPAISLLNFVEALPPAESSPFQAPVATSCQTYSFALNPCWKIYNPSWNFGDGSPVSTASNVSHTYANNGVYTASLTLNYNGTPLPVYTRTINVFSAASISISGPTVICNGSTYMNNYSIPQQAGASYLWSASNATISGFNTLYNANVSGGPVGVATISVQVTNGGCVAGATKTVNVANTPQVNLASTSTLVCASQNVTLTGSPAGGSYSGTNNNSNVFSSAITGTHTVTYTYGNSGCYNSASKIISVNSCTGIDELSLNGGIYIYPNPANNVLYISSPAKKINYVITDMLGRQVLQGNYQAGIGIEALSKAIYFISLTADNGQKHTFKFVKE